MTRFIPYAIDVAAVLVFVAIGRRSHEEAASVAGFLVTSAPFLIGAVASWALLAVARPGGSLVPALAVWAVTVLVGVLLRRFAFGEGAPASFVVVTSLVLALLMVGGRLLAYRLA